MLSTRSLKRRRRNTNELASSGAIGDRSGSTPVQSMSGGWGIMPMDRAERSDRK
jgi:hypothetical protein